MKFPYCRHLATSKQILLLLLCRSTGVCKTEPQTIHKSIILQNFAWYFLGSWNQKIIIIIIIIVCYEKDSSWRNGEKTGPPFNDDDDDEKLFNRKRPCEMKMKKKKDRHQQCSDVLSIVVPWYCGLLLAQVVFKYTVLRYDQYFATTNTSIIRAMQSNTSCSSTQMTMTMMMKYKYILTRWSNVPTCEHGHQTGRPKAGMCHSLTSFVRFVT